MIRLIQGFFQARSRTSLVLMSLALVIGIGSIDYADYFSLGLFYVAPIALVAWYVSRSAGVAFALLSALVWYFINSAVVPPQMAQEFLIWNSAVRFGFFMVIASLVSSLRLAYDQQKTLALTDSLTGLLNGRAFKHRASIELMRARRNKYEVAILYLDLDNFKAFNDSRGHFAGDLLLRNISIGLASSLRSTDLLGRLGGDEFAVLLAGTSAPQVRATASRLQAAVLSVAPALEPPVTLTIGAVTSDGFEDIESLLSRADNMMYQGKASLRGSILVNRIEGDA